jgi:hypothetical protein
VRNGEIVENPKIIPLSLSQAHHYKVDSLPDWNGGLEALPPVHLESGSALNKKPLVVIPI